MKRLFAPLFCAAAFLMSPATAHALEGDCEAGIIAKAFISPQANIYGGGAELYFAYDALDGLSFHVAAGFYGGYELDIDDAVGLYNMRVGLMYALDILEWVPAIGVHFSELMSESGNQPWADGYNGWAVDFDLQVEYRGIRNVGIGFHFTYHLVFTNDDYMTAGFSVSWHSDTF